MKKYIKPTACVVELQAKENIAANPIEAASVEPISGGGYTTVYDMTFFGTGSTF